MPFPKSIHLEAIERSGRFCCVCHEFAGRSAVVHHIIQESDGGPNTIENAIVLCPRCHGEAGHYNPHHPLGTKYSPEELQRHRDDWWAYRKSDYSANARPADFLEKSFSGQGIPVQRKPVGVLWSRRIDIPESQEIIEFEGRLLAESHYENQSYATWTELYQRGHEEFYVYQQWNHRADWFDARLHGAPYFDEPDSPLSLSEVQQRFPELVSAAGLVRVRRV